MSDDHARWRPPGRDGGRGAFVSDEGQQEPQRWMRGGIAGTSLEPLVRIEELTKHYQLGPQTVEALKGIDLNVDRGQVVAIQGRSGSGKTTFLNLVGGLDTPTSGSVRVDDEEVTLMDENSLVRLRREKIGFIFQAFGLIPILSAAENVEIPLRLTRTAIGERSERVRILLELVGLHDRATHRPHELSGGEQQRVAIARALANGPQLLLADEPTGQLDSRTGRTIMNLIRSLVRTEGLTAIVATHDPALIDIADRVVELSDGEIIADSDAEVAPFAPRPVTN